MLKSIILASQSPRRRELMLLLNIPFSSENPQIEEELDPSLPLVKAIEKIAIDKALDVFQHHPKSIVIGSDTVVVIDDVILGKPIDNEDAIRMLDLLSGKTHKVITGVCMISDKEKVVFHSISKVTFYPLTDAMIKSYVASNLPLDKAGAYGIQDRGALFIKSISGDYYTIMGLPIAEVSRRLRLMDGGS
ncbi:MAG: septum formation protein [Erysipelotrichaceae bacterium]|nr:MAG: septum formation [Erysipelotrichaceae bacterium]TXT16234.1 MAG: septum formation protein [Erysipelotrichaceae bacterium]